MPYAHHRKRLKGVATRRIFNIGNPANCASIRELAQMMVEVASEFPTLRERAKYQGRDGDLRRLLR
jgi:hypothetical protein